MSSPPALYTPGIPALPRKNRERQAALRGFICNWLASSKGSAFLAEGDFEHVAANAALGVDRDSLRVTWSEPQTSALTRLNCRSVRNQPDHAQ